jgi:hypothetical protein
MKTKKTIHIKRRLLKRRNTKKQNKKQIGGNDIIQFTYSAKNKNGRQIDESFGYNTGFDKKGARVFNFYRKGRKDEENNQDEMVNVGIIKFYLSDDNTIVLGWVFISPGKYPIPYQGRGYGTAMLAAFEQYVKSTDEYKNITKLQLVPEYYSGKQENKPSCGLCKFYEKSGYSQIVDENPMYQKIIRPQ